MPAQALSLFAERRLFELRMPSGKPDKGAALLARARRAAAARRSVPDHHRQARPKSQRGSRGCAPSNGTAHGSRSWPVGAAALPGWLAARAQRAARAARSEAPHSSSSIASKATCWPRKQELEKLALLANGEPIDAALVHAHRRRQRPLRRLPAGGGGRGRRCGARAAGAARARRAREWSRRSFCGRWCASCAGCGRRANATACARSRGAAGLEPGGEALGARARAPAEAAARAAAAQASAHGSHHQGVGARAMPWTALIGLTGAFAGALQAPWDSGRVAP